MDEKRLARSFRLRDIIFGKNYLIIDYEPKQYIIVNLYLEIQCSGQNSSECKVAGETCIDGVCRCGLHSSSCEGRKTGEFCDPIASECRCTESLPSCSDPSRGNICDAKGNVCKCSATVPACYENDYCTLGSCIGN